VKRQQSKIRDHINFQTISDCCDGCDKEGISKAPCNTGRIRRVEVLPSLGPQSFARKVIVKILKQKVVKLIVRYFKFYNSDMLKIIHLKKLEEISYLME
jgi:hypothetical protein